MTIFFIGILMLVYGYLCRLFTIYFFWDSKHFGWILVTAGILGLFIDQRKSRLAQKRSIFFIRIGTGLLVFAFTVMSGAVLVVKTSGVYDAAAELIKLDGAIKNEIGDVRGFGLFPTGPEILRIANGATDGTASFVVTVRGDKAYRDVKVNLQGSAQTGWHVSSVQVVYM